MYKYDLHVHTSEVSWCGKRISDDLIRDYAELGFDGVVITDHFSENYIQSYNVTDWKEKMDLQFKGYENARVMGEELGVKVFMGMELRLHENQEIEMLVFGVTREFINSHENFHLLSSKELYQLLVVEHGMAMFQAHPFRKGGDVLPRDVVNGVEMINGGKPFEYNEKAYYYSLENNIQTISASDNHNYGAGTCGICTQKPIIDNNNLVNVLRDSNSYNMFCSLDYSTEHPIWSHPKLVRTQATKTKAFMKWQEENQN